MILSQKRFVPIVDKNIRNHAIFRAVVTGQSCESVGFSHRIGESRVRQVLKNVAFATLRHARLTDPTIPMQYTFHPSEFTAAPALWLERLAAYEQSLKES